MKSYVYTASKLATSTAERTLVRIIEPAKEIQPSGFLMESRPFTIWHPIEHKPVPRLGSTQGATFHPTPAIIQPAVQETVKVFRAVYNRRTRKAIEREKATVLVIRLAA